MNDAGGAANDNRDGTLEKAGMPNNRDGMHFVKPFLFVIERINEGSVPRRLAEKG